MLRRPSATPLYVFPASNSPLALVIRRGPSKWWHFLLWNRDNGAIVHGSWFNGMLYPHRCDLSPRGDTMLVLAYRGAKEPLAWTALCRPPYVRAQVFWPHKSAKLGGGFFDRRLPIAWINLYPESSIMEHRGPCALEFGYLDQEKHCFGSFHERLERDGWRPAPGSKKKADDDPHPRQTSWVKPSPSGKHELILEIEAVQHSAWDVAQFPDSIQYSLRNIAERTVLPMDGVSWANWNTRGEVCVAAGGCLYTADASDPLKTLGLVVDLNPLQPRNHPVEGSTEHAELKSDG